VGTSGSGASDIDAASSAMWSDLSIIQLDVIDRLTDNI
jgi:hypothetical protein